MVVHEWLLPLSATLFITPCSPATANALCVLCVGLSGSDAAARMPVLEGHVSELLQRSL